MGRVSGSLTVSAVVSGKRVVHQADALVWLTQNKLSSDCSLVTSLPDISEFSGIDPQEWKNWFVEAASLVLEKTPPEGVTIFFQTDVKHRGEWIDKAYLVQKAAEARGHVQQWHKIVCRVSPGLITYGRPAYSHLLCFSKKVRADVAKSTPDVLPLPGDKTWTRGMGVNACLAAGRFILTNTSTRTVVDPFCGHGTVLAVANELGLDAIGIELSAKRARKARQLQSQGFVLSDLKARPLTT